MYVALLTNEFIRVSNMPLLLEWKDIDSDIIR